MNWIAHAGEHHETTTQSVSHVTNTNFVAYIFITVVFISIIFLLASLSKPKKQSKQKDEPNE
jgi:F0F1-type ATP synthase membrane subunit a